MICPKCFSDKNFAYGPAWQKCKVCGNIDLVTTFWKCPFKGKGCAKEDTCEKTAYQVSNCGLYRYMKFLWDNY